MKYGWTNPFYYNLLFSLSAGENFLGALHIGRRHAEMLAEHAEDWRNFETTAAGEMSVNYGGTDR